MGQHNAFWITGTPRCIENCRHVRVYDARGSASRSGGCEFMPIEGGHICKDEFRPISVDDGNPMEVSAVLDFIAEIGCALPRSDQKSDIAIAHDVADLTRL